MKKLMVVLVSILILFTASVSFLPAQQKSARELFCQILYEIAVEGPRLMFDPASNRVVGELLPIGKCFDKICVLSESVSECGWIEQYIDLDGDKKKDVTAVWQPLFDIDTNIVSFVLYGTKDRVINM